MRDKTTVRRSKREAKKGERTGPTSPIEGRHPRLGRFSPGEVIDDKFRLERRLGMGGMSSVWAAWDLVLERPVALKLLGGALLYNADWRERFAIEARHIARIRHENVIQVHSSGTHLGWPYFVMDLVDGVTLTAWRRARPKPSLSEVVELVCQIAEGLDAVHTAGLVHRDVKPSNVLIDKTGHVTLLDLGLSSTLARAAAQTDGSGTPSYMAPEQIGSTRVPIALATRSDVYQLGVTTFELLVGELPFDDDSVVSVFDRHRLETPRPPSVMRREIAPGVDAAMLRALAKDPLERYASASAFAAALTDAAAEPEAPVGEGERGPIRVLVAEDDQDALTATCATLRGGLASGSSVTGVADGEAALALAFSEHWDALVLDLNMPRLGGLDVVARLESARENKPYIVVVTAEGGPDDWRWMRGHGVDAILLKPFDGDDLVSMIRRHISTSRTSSTQRSPVIDAESGERCIQTDLTPRRLG